MGRDDSYRFGLVAHPGRSKGAARYDVGLLAHTQSRPALTDVSPEQSPCPEPCSLPSPALPVQRPLTPYRHTRYDEDDRLIKIVGPGLCVTYYDHDANGRIRARIDSEGNTVYYH